MNLIGAKKKLLEHEERWEKKQGLKLIYEDFFRAIQYYCVEGSILEVGGGFGGFKQHCGSVVCTDIVRMPSLDVVCDAHYLPFMSGAFSNIVSIDLLHHLERPIRFLRQAAEVLKIGGRLIVFEPAITPVGRLIYAFHDERVDMTINPLEDGPLSVDRNPFEANQAIGTLIGGVFRGEHEKRNPQLKLMYRGWKGLFGYPLSGGFRRWSLIPRWMIRPVLKFEDFCTPLLGPIMASRLLLVFERVDPPA